MYCVQAFILLGVFYAINGRELSGYRQKRQEGSETLEAMPMPTFSCTAEGVNQDGNNANPAEDYCSKYFFTCSPGQSHGTLRMCSGPDGIVYDNLSDSCQMSEFVESCGGNATTTVEPTTAALDTTFNCSGLLAGNYPDSQMPCSTSFYSCQDGIEYGLLRSCNIPPGTVYDVVSDSCQYPEFTEACGGMATTSTYSPPPTTNATEESPSSTTSAPAFVCSEGAVGNFPNPQVNCSSVFYSCQPGQTAGIERRCFEPDTVYDAPSDACLLPIHVDACGGSTTTQGTPTSTQEPIPSEFDCTGLSIGNHPNSMDNCSSLFFTCIGGQYGVLRFCDHGTVYDPAQDRCEYPEYVVSCGGNTTTTSTSTASTTTTTQMSNTTISDDNTTTTVMETTTTTEGFSCSGLPFGNYPASEGCSSSFYSCPGPVHRACPQNTYFDQEFDQCLFYEDVPECSGTARPNTTTTEATSTTTTAQAAEGEFTCTLRYDGNYAAGDCAEFFWQCSNGRRFRVPCASASLRYSGEIDACVAAAMVPGCRMDNLMLDMSSNQPCAGRANGFYPDPMGDCTKYAMCINFNIFSINCNPGLVYDTSINRCAIPERVSGACGLAPPATFSCDEEVDGYHRSKMDCAVHYKCESGVLKAVKTCPQFYAFDTATEECLPVQQVDECQPDKDLPLGQQFCTLAQSDGIFANPQSCHSGVICLFDRLAQTHNAFTFVCTDPNEPDFYPDTARCGPPRAGCSLEEEQLMDQ